MKHTKPATEQHDARHSRNPSAVFATDAARWRAVQQRDAAADGRFVYSVATTGVYCRPTCPARRALRQNVVFHATCADAERAGYRACKRCQPATTSQRKRQVAAVSKACRLLQDCEPVPTLSELAEAVGISAYHFHRVFKSTLGVTPRQFAASLRTGRVRAELRGRESVTAAIYEAGFNSNSRFYEHSSDTLGMTPSEYRSGGSGIIVQFAIVLCPLGLVLVAGTARGICSVRFGDRRSGLEEELRRDFPKAVIQKGNATFGHWVRSIVDHLKHPSGGLDLPLDLRGTAFQQRVWQALRGIPVGHTASYAEVAAAIGKPSAARAVARACAANPTAVVVPCHRVVRTNGKISGYRWGIERKRKLLERERAP